MFEYLFVYWRDGRVGEEIVTGYDENSARIEFLSLHRSATILRIE